MKPPLPLRKIKRLADQSGRNGRRQQTRKALEKLASQQHPRPKEDR